MGCVRLLAAIFLLLSISISSANAQQCHDIFIEKSLGLSKVQKLVHSALTYQFLLKFEERWRETLQPDFKLAADQGFNRADYDLLARTIYKEMHSYLTQTDPFKLGESMDLAKTMEQAPTQQVVQELAYLLYGLQRQQRLPRHSQDLKISHLNERPLDRTMETSKFASDISLPLYGTGIVIGLTAGLLGNSSLGHTLSQLSVGISSAGLLSGMGGFLGVMGSTLVFVGDSIRFPTVRIYQESRVKVKIHRFRQQAKKHFRSLPDDKKPTLDINPLLDSLQQTPLMEPLRYQYGGGYIVI